MSVGNGRARRSGSLARGTKPTVISLFSCGMGMDIGFGKAGFDTRYANDITNFACETINTNRPGIPYDHADIADVASRTIMRKASLKQGEVDVVIGGPPCQPFSTAGKRRGANDKRSLALQEYMRIIRDVRPKFFVFENVPGIITASKSHTSFYKRMSSPSKKLSRDWFDDFLKNFKALRGYAVDWGVFNAADYGVSQKRKRLILIGSRTANPSTVLDIIREMANFSNPDTLNGGGKLPWRTLKDALRGLHDADKEYVEFPPWGKYLEHVKAGGCWINLPRRMQRRAMGGAADSADPLKKGKQGGRRGFYRRLSWDAPAPTLVTSPTQRGSCMCHPDETRPLTVRECARIQGFPDNWHFVGTTMQKYRMIGEAVPIEMAKAVAVAIKKFC